jgi:hypothetical protein
LIGTDLQRDAEGIASLCVANGYLLEVPVPNEDTYRDLSGCVCEGISEDDAVFVDVEYFTALIEALFMCKIVQEELNSTNAHGIPNLQRKASSKGPLHPNYLQ